MTPRVISRDRFDALGEGPLWSARENALYWTDILGCRINRLSLDSDEIVSWQMADFTGWMIERAQGGFVAGIGRDVVALGPDGAIGACIATLDTVAGNRVNDAKADARGRIWAGSMPVGCDRFSGAFYRLDIDGSVHCVDDGYCIANGPAIAADGRTLFHTDSGLRTIFCFAVQPDGGLGPREPFIEFEDGWGNPDGMTLDADGGLWVACWGAGQVKRFTPDGQIDRAIDLPASQITSCTFAGPALDRMFVTSAADGVDEPLGGALFEVDPGCRGLPTQMYRG